MSDAKTALSKAVQNGNLSEVVRLLNTGSGSSEADSNGLRPIHYAAAYGHTDIFVMLAKKKEHKETFNSDSEWNCLDLAVDNYHAEIAFKIIDMETWEQSLESKSGLYDTPMRKLIRNTPEVARVVLDKCTTIGSHKGFKVLFNYKYLDDTLVLNNWRKVNKLNAPEATEQQNTSYKNSETVQNNEEKEPYSNDRSIIKENHPLMIMIKSNRTELVDHPLVSALLKRTWTVGLVITVMNILLYAVFLALLTGFTLSLDAPYMFNVSTFSINSTCSDLADQNISTLASVSKYGVFVMAAIEILIEIVEITQMYPYRGLWRYAAKLENWFEWIACIAAIIFVFDTNDCHDTGFRQEWQWTCGTISVFLAWINMLAILRKFEWIGIYVVMLHRIVKVFTKFFCVFSLLIVAFAVAFHCLFQNQDQFSTFGISLVKTTSMMVGEIDFGNIFFEENVNFGFLSFAFFYLFVLLMTIVVINLLVGLAVENIHEFRRNASLAKRRMQVEFALDLERFLTRNLLLKICYWLIDLRYDDEEKQENMKQKGHKILNGSDNCTEEFVPPDKNRWLQGKWDELWKLTEYDIRQGLKVEDIPGSISKLNKKIDTLEAKIETLMGQSERGIDTEESTF